jgi:hypothetical protein
MGSIRNGIEPSDSCMLNLQDGGSLVDYVLNDELVEVVCDSAVGNENS